MEIFINVTYYTFAIIVMLRLLVFICDADELLYKAVNFLKKKNKPKNDLEFAYTRLEHQRDRLRKKKKLDKKEKRDLAEIEKSMAFINKALVQEGKVDKDKLIGDLADIIGEYHIK